MTVLVAEALTVRRGGRAILADVSLTLRGGMFVAVLGANGAGKSTLLAVLARLLVPDEGAVNLDDLPLARIAPRELARRRAYLPQNPRVEWPIAVERLVALGLAPDRAALGRLSPDHSVRLDATLAACDLLALRDRPATTLSGGELARAMLARALVGDPALLIADEPLAGLDPAHALDGIARLRALADGGRLVIASLHDLTLALRHASHVLVLRQGRLLAFGPTAVTLDAALLRAAFGVEACVSGAGRGAFVDFVAATHD